MYKSELMIGDQGEIKNTPPFPSWFFSFSGSIISLDILNAKSESESTSFVAVVRIVLTSALIPSMIRSGFFFQFFS